MSMYIADAKKVFLGAATELDILMRADFWGELVDLLARVGAPGTVFRGVPILDLKTALAPLTLGHTSNNEQVLLRFRPQSDECSSRVYLAIGDREVMSQVALYELYCADGDPAHGCEKPHALIANLFRGVESRYNTLLRHAESIKDEEFHLTVYTFMRKHIREFRELRERFRNVPQFYPTSLHRRALLRVAMRFWSFS